MTEFAKIRFRVCEFEDGTPYLGTEENGPASNTVLHDKMNVTLRFKSGVTSEQAQEIKNYLNQHIEQISVTL